MLNMIASSNGLATLDGLSGKLSGDEDRELFRTLRGMADFILVGLKTVLEERYNPPKLDDELATFRKSSGKGRLPRVVVVSNSLEIDSGIPLFASELHSPILITSESSPLKKRESLAKKYDIVLSGEERVDFREAIDALTEGKGGIVLVEGGPSINKQLVTADLFDELCITVSPFHSNDANGELVTTDKSYPHGDMEETRRIVVNDFTFYRYLRKR
tara:strand:- start:520 stop:1167 length:648 start_codon:yes stop_codon:yes gene_type:complete